MSGGESLDLTILAPAFAAGLLVLATHVPLGRQVLARGIIFIDLAIAQVAGLGVILAASHGWDEQGLATQLAAFAAAMGGALLLWMTERLWPEVQEALIGVLFVLAACIGILLLAGNPQGGEHLRELLVGQILWVEAGHLWPVAVSYGLVLAIWFGLPVRGHPLVFYPLFAVTVTISVQLVGVYLVFASLILPALAVRGRGPVQGLWLGYGLGALGYAAGLLASLWFDLPAGALIVCCLLLCVLPVLWARRGVRQSESTRMEPEGTPGI